MDYTELSNEELDQERLAIIREQERRENQKRIPQQVEELAEKYVSGGGDRTVLAEAINTEQPVGEDS